MVNKVSKLELAQLVLEYLRVLLAAPFLISVVVVFFIWRFTEDIKALLLRVAENLSSPVAQKLTRHRAVGLLKKNQNLHLKQ